LSENGRLPVIRGKAGCSQTIGIWNLVVGDVILLKAGDSIPADCIMIEGSNCVVDETNHQKSPEVNKSADKDPFLLANSTLVNG